MCLSVASWCSLCFVLLCVFFVRAICHGALKLDISTLFTAYFVFEHHFNLYYMVFYVYDIYLQNNSPWLLMVPVREYVQRKITMFNMYMYIWLQPDKIIVTMVPRIFDNNRLPVSVLGSMYISHAHRCCSRNRNLRCSSIVMYTILPPRPVWIKHAGFM